MSDEIRSVMEYGTNTRALRIFDEVLEDAADSYGEKYDEVDVHPGGPLVHAYPGPALDVTISNHSDFRLTGGDGWELDIRVEVTDYPYHVDDIVEDGDLDIEGFEQSLTDLDPERARSRGVRISPEDDGDGFSDEELNRWFCLNLEIRNILEPERTRTTDEIDYWYLFDLKDTQP